MQRRVQDWGWERSGRARRRLWKKHGNGGQCCKGKWEVNFHGNGDTENMEGWRNGTVGRSSKWFVQRQQEEGQVWRRDPCDSWIKLYPLLAGRCWPRTERLGLCHYREHRVMLSTPKAGLRKKWMWIWKMANQEELDEWQHSLTDAVWGGACKDRQRCELGRILQSVSELTVVGMRYWMNGQMLTG